MRSLLLAAACAAALSAQKTGSAVPPNLNFEVASLRPSSSPRDAQLVRPAPGGERYIATNATLRFMLMVAYRLKPDQIQGGPTWMDREGYDMNAKAERPSTGPELHAMLANLLIERFKLQFHHETRDMPVYVLSVDGSGAKLTEHSAQSAGDPWIDQSIEGAVHVKLTVKSSPLPYFAWRLGLMMDRPVVDRTGLEGHYDFSLAFTRDLPPGIPANAMINGAPIDTGGPTIFAALKQQLGLRLDSERGPVDILVIDHAERPAVN